MHKKTCRGECICFHKNINMIQTLLNSVILCLVCGCYGKVCTLILRAKRRRQLPQSAGRDRLHLFQQQKYLSGYCTRKCRSLVVLPMKCGNGLDIQHESGNSARTIVGKPHRTAVTYCRTETMHVLVGHFAYCAHT
jgi:hypothetical protein